MLVSDVFMLLPSGPIKLLSNYDHVRASNGGTQYTSHIDVRLSSVYHTHMLCVCWSVMGGSSELCVVMSSMYR